MSDETKNETGDGSNGDSGGGAVKKAVRRKPLWLAIPAGTRQIEQGGNVENEQLYTIQKFANGTDVRKFLEKSEMDQSNVDGVLLFRTDAIPVETKMKAQIVIKFGKED